MRVLQVSNLVSHHQLPLARELARAVGDENFRFVATAVPDAERARLGWNSDVDEPWILRAGERESDRLLFEQWWDEADVVICGERRFERMSDRLVRKKLCFYMSERWWKPPLGMARLLDPRFLKVARQFRKICKYSDFHYLPMGPFAAGDISLLSRLDGRIWNWGYFTDVPGELSTGAIRTERLKLLWVGRMLAWKRVDTLIKALASLPCAVDSFELTLVGDGPERGRLECLARKLLVHGNYQFLDPVPAAEVPGLMRQSHVYILPSSEYEGWGAVVNEAMTCGCAVVASKGAGASAAMIENKVNGVLFNPGDWRGLADSLRDLERDEAWRQYLGVSAQSLMSDVWSPAAAAARFLTICNALLENRSIPSYKSGPMSKV